MQPLSPLTTERYAPLAALIFSFVLPQINCRAFLDDPSSEDYFTPLLHVTPSKTEFGNPDNTLFPSPLQPAPNEPAIHPCIAQDEPHQVH